MFYIILIIVVQIYDFDSYINTHYIMYRLCHIIMYSV